MCLSVCRQCSILFHLCVALCLVVSVYVRVCACMFCICVCQRIHACQFMLERASADVSECLCVAGCLLLWMIPRVSVCLCVLVCLRCALQITGLYVQVSMRVSRCHCAMPVQNVIG